MSNLAKKYSDREGIGQAEDAMKMSDLLDQEGGNWKKGDCKILFEEHLYHGVEGNAKDNPEVEKQFAEG